MSLFNANSPNGPYLHAVKSPSDSPKGIYTRGGSSGRYTCESSIIVGSGGGRMARWAMKKVYL